MVPAQPGYNSCAQIARICAPRPVTTQAPPAARIGYARAGPTRRPHSVISIRAWMSKRVGNQMPATPCLAAQGRARARRSPNPSHQALGGHDVPHRR